MDNVVVLKSFARERGIRLHNDTDDAAALLPVAGRTTTVDVDAASIVINPQSAPSKQITAKHVHSGYMSREPYLQTVADTYNVPLQTVTGIAYNLGATHDFDRLLQLVDIAVHGS